MNKDFFKQVLEWVQDYIDVEKLSEDVKVALIARFEELMETDTLPVVIKRLYEEFKDDNALSIDEISVIIVEYVSSSVQSIKE